ncbi:MAG: multifunctional oxoglutarate decarboxylase/oxoglutarate dehydrogenase thiamine pyrophosphate-binding subunit/dihydrolipoyllysine-residue succinyltransferase subunit [Ilumatobacter sp.]|uniref:multifunctional oxoglutarate decarboxylase/oxoglutarate dehydrogenase thiamine pyrophosphate-binding subunit/dihydrolipoyllysine-residue succinyltransferase subunit n=1 Tax=Ilumatobacter sp. TaxID=1967498 RepID=UPI002630207E|nr:multifunctional oxoglutarate decarboxylase/oxoglutarate dehydrogenase thiamine pyrophosphate-binding subunit/dihydrolipoyllysine-residue succinyltransferase subunit [Ilumatobacter sp.]MDJ0768887.1 multifunctional oxoglutarate decarboxylase/oxoglutarate dehydrogenase thiamine pyrophosphate-binding subunit/dihydrolipoyllysine-residue succinyltransferase subunit [Ilumatobacter sp.]
MSTTDASSPGFGANSWLVEEMYEQYQADPSSVGESWREFFEDYRSASAGTVTAAVAEAPPAEVAPSAPAAPTVEAVPAEPAEAAPTAAPPAAAAPAEPADAAPTAAPPAGAKPAAVADEPGEPIRGVGAAIVKNMAASLDVPTATSFRNVPAKLLEVNRKVINGYRARTGMGKVSFTHLIGYAVVKAIATEVPNMKNGFAEGVDGKPRIVRHDHVNMGLAVDVDKGDGTRTLIVPVLKNADTLDFGGFLAAYEEIIRKVKNNKLTLDDYAGANITLTNPGTIGTVQSVPRLMPGQGVIVGVGNIDYPAEFEGADFRNLSSLGVSKVVTVTSTYDHRIIQGAESGLFLKRVHELLLGEHGFYEDIFHDLDMPYEAVKWRPDINPIDREEAMLAKQMAVAKLIRVHRVRGHLIADLDPLHWKEPHTPRELDPATYGLTIWDLDREFLTDGVGGTDKLRLGDLLGVLRDAYCRTIGVEYMHIQNTDEQRWIQEHVEIKQPPLTKDEKHRVLERVNAAEAFEKFLATKYVGTKRFGIEGAESAIPILDQVLSCAADADLDGAVIGMAHRGRLNVLSNIMGKSYEAIFSEFEGHVDPDTVQGSGDVKYHLGATGKYESPSGRDIAVELAANPSHLETVDPIVLGMVRAMQDQIEPRGAHSVLPLLIHGDAAFAGQGVVAECLAMSNISGFRIGGTIHLIINNQIGFTTAPEFSRSSLYCSDVAKTVQAPIFHVNGDDPEACVRVAKLAWEYRQTFGKDVVIDMVCYRRHGHNEGDDPSYTQPLMYKAIAERRSVRKLYVESLVKRGDITVDEAEQALADFQGKLQIALDETRSRSGDVPEVPPPPKPLGVLPHIPTGVERATLERIFEQLTAFPEGFTPHPKLLRQFEARNKQFASEHDVDWATAEALAIGSLVLEGHPVRLAGEDSRRGTFSQRHAAVVDFDTGDPWVPINELPDAQARFWVYDTLLSEYAALGYEYGYSHANPGALVMWEAQFGDFVNGAQVIIDQYIVAAEDKWGQRNGVVLLLPHGYEGQGPEHSSARIERFLTLAAEDNMQVCNATTAAQYFHLLRRQVHQERQTPLVIFTPKQGLRMKQTRSHIDELTMGSFEEVIDDPGVTDPASVKRVIFCSGKVAWDAIAERDARGAPAAIVRVEQLYPLPSDQMLEIVRDRYVNAKELRWLQEEPENMGAWNFIEHHTWRVKDLGYDLRHIARVESGSPATGSKTVHDQELVHLMERAFTGL